MTFLNRGKKLKQKAEESKKMEQECAQEYKRAIEVAKLKANQFFALDIPPLMEEMQKMFVSRVEITKQQSAQVI